MSIKKQYIFYFFICLPALAQTLFGQDPIYTQFSNTPLYYNPAFTGFSNGLHIRFSTRNQGPALATTLRSYYLSADIADRNLPGSGGFGIIFNTDNEGLGFIQNYNIGVSFAVRVPLANSIVGQLGVKGAWLQKHIAWDEFKMSELVIERYGNIYDSGFIQPDNNVLNLPDFAIGGLVQFISSQGCVSGTVGMAVDHLFEPDQSFLPAEKAPLPRKWIGHADMIWAVNCRSGTVAANDQIMKINPAIIFQYQHGLDAIIAGLNATRYGLYLGLWYKGLFGTHTTASIALMGGYRYAFAANMSIKFTYCYDKQIAGIPSGSVGAHEISLMLEFGNVRLFKGSGRSLHRLMTPKGIESDAPGVTF
ncbi:MAG: PorP/SprF family type IX secretion system membrane protein [Bacteroidetes bacterium]|nr:PorP/SprF family type IX secretion system membrane protein [Bacteroidota bacterium]